MYERLKELCKEKGMSVTSLCVQVTGSKGNLETWKKGNMRLDHLVKCAAILEVSTDYILGVNEPPTPSFTREELAGSLRTLTEAEVDELIFYSEYLLYKRKNRPKTDGQEK